MGIAFLLQFLDKAALAASTLLGMLDPTTGGIVSLFPHLEGHHYDEHINVSNSMTRLWQDLNLHGAQESSTLGTLFSASQAPTLSSACQSESIWLLLLYSGAGY